MFAPSPKSSSHKRIKPYARKTQPMARSGSLLGTIKNIVAAPLSWWGSNKKFEDLHKRRRPDAHDVSGEQSEGDGEDEGEGEGDVEGRTVHRSKRLRRESPENEHPHQSASGYLDPPPSSFRASQQIATSSKRGGDARKQRPASTSFSDSRTMSVDPQTRYSTLRRDPTIPPFPPASSLNASHSMSLGPRDSSIHPPPSPFKLRTSLTPQPSFANPLRREASAPPPLLSLQSRPMFVKPPPEESSARQLRAQKTLSLGTLAEFSRSTLSPSRDRMLTSFGSLSSIPSQLSNSLSLNASLQIAPSKAEKTFHKLEMYKTPIIPSRYKDAKVIPDFLKPKRAHVPVPMSKRSRDGKPSLGMAKSKNRDKDADAETTERERDSGKPYGGKGGLSKLLARRKAEAEEEMRNSSKYFSNDDDEDPQMDAGAHSGKRDIGVYAKLTSGSEDERSKKHKRNGVNVGKEISSVSELGDPFVKAPVSLPQGGRMQPYGRVGRTRTRDPGLRSVPLGRTVNTNKFSAALDDDDGMDDEGQAMDTADDTGDGKAFAAEKEREAEAIKPVFEAPKGFSFADGATSIQHDHAQAKEPPITSLPFSIGKLTEKPTAVTEEATGKPAETSPLTKPFASTFPAAQQAPTKAEEVLAAAPTHPKLSIVPLTPAQPAQTSQETSLPKNVFATPSASSGAVVSSSTPSASGIPNFFANSALLAGNKATAAPAIPLPSSSLFASPTATTLATSPSAPISDSEKPTWSKDASPAITSNATAPKIASSKPTEPKPIFGGADKPFAFGAKSTENVNTTSAIPSPTPPLFFSAVPKSAEPSADTQSVNASMFGGKTVSASPAPSGLAPSSSGASVPSVSHFAPSTQTSATKSAEVENKQGGLSPSPFFAFTGSNNAPKPLFGAGSASSPSAPFLAQATQPAQTTISSTESKPSFQFGAPPVPDGISNTSATSANAAPVVPKPLFGGPSGSGFSFGASTAPASSTSGTDAVKSPFAFGAPPATPPSGAERKNSPFSFGAPAPSSSGGIGFGFGAAAKANETATMAPAPVASPFAFGASSARPVTPPSKADEGMNMEESPTRMDMNGSRQNKPADGMTFGLGATPVNPFGQAGGNNTSSMFTFGAAPTTMPAPSPFGVNEENKTAAPSSGFGFNRTSSAPAISTTFSFGQKSDDSSPPVTAFGATSNLFGQPPPSSGGAPAPFGFGQQTAAASNPFGAPSQQQQPTTAAPGPSTPSSPYTNSPSFTFGGPAAASNNPFNFGGSQPASPANVSAGLPQSSGNVNTSSPSFTFGQSSGSSGSTLFNIGAPPPATPGGTPSRQVKKLPRRAGAPRR